MSARQAALTEPAATALHAIDRATRALARPLPEARVLVIGGGAVGLLAALLLKAYGCRDVLVAETNPLRRESAAKRERLRDLRSAHGEGRRGQHDRPRARRGRRQGHAQRRARRGAARRRRRPRRPDGLGERDRHAQAHARRDHADRHLHVFHGRPQRHRRGADRGTFGDLAWVEERASPTARPPSPISTAAAPPPPRSCCARAGAEARH